MSKKDEIMEEIKKLKQQIKDLQEQIIDFELPKNYDKMSKEEKEAYHKKQEKLKEEALKNLDNYSVVLSDYTMVSYPKTRSIVNRFVRDVGKRLTSIQLVRDVFKRNVPEKVKELHKTNLEDIEKQIERYNSTKAIRNDKLEFGANFSNFAETYFNKRTCVYLEKKANKIFLEKYERQNDKNGNVIGDQFKIQNLTDEQRKFLIKTRMKVFTDRLEYLQRIASIKVKNDSYLKQSTFLEKYTFLSNQVPYRNGAKKWTKVNSIVSKSGVDMAKIKRKRSELKSDTLTDESREEKNKSRYIELNVMREKFDNFVKFYKGNGRQFSVEFQQNFPEMAEKIYQNKTGGILSFGSQNLSSSPISVQEHEIEKQFDEELRKVNYRLKLSSYFIPASISTGSVFLGKNLTNAKTKTEQKLDKMKVKEYEKELKNIDLREDLISYESIFDSLGVNIKNEFNKYTLKHMPRFEKLSEKTKKNELKKFFRIKIDKLSEKVNKNKFFSSGAEELEKLNGVMISKAEKVITREMKSIIEALGDEQGAIYKNLIQTIKESNNKYNNEKQQIDKLSEKLDNLTKKPYSYENNKQIQKLMSEIDSHNKKMNIIKSSLDKAVQKKSLFEANYASKQIGKAIASKENKVVSLNMSKSVFDKYAFPAVDTFGEKYNIEKNSIEGKQIEKVVSSFIMNFKNQVQNMELSFEESKYEAIKNHVIRLRDYIEDDFGATIRDLKKTQKLFVSSLKECNDSKDSETALELEKYIQRLSKIESDLIKKLKAMNIEINDVTLAKKQK